jgi:murein DD-endopeptidase MepM/ murein hydrolase activator NlpD
MPRTHRDHLVRTARTYLSRGLIPVRRHVMNAAALLLVVTSVLLVLDARLPFPSPSERIIYDPSDWSMLLKSPAAIPPRAGGEKTTVPALSVGGYTPQQPPLTVMLYKARPGDTFSGIAGKLGLDIDTVSSMNRTEGRGVHNVTVGELIRIPSQNGIYLTLNGDFDEMCRKYSVAPEDVLGANALARPGLHAGMTLFFPGVQHTGYARALAEGVGVALPLRGWESSPYGQRSDPFTGQRSRHRGVDIAAPMGSSIRSATDGVVRNAGWDDLLGNYVEVRGQLGYSYVYGHMSRILVGTGTRVPTGKVIGLVGDTGYATGPHLHFEVRKFGVPQNPKYYLPGIR